jgi:hypothetical protein
MKKQLFLIILLLLQFLIVFAPPIPSSYPGSNWGYNAKIYINGAYIDTDLVNFTVLVDINSTIAGRCNANASDIRFLDPDNVTEYEYEIELWNASDTSYVWVKIPRIECDAINEFYLYYNNTGASDNQSSADAWDVNYTGVWHLNESGSTYNDSTGNYNNGTGTSITNNESGMVGYCASVNANTDRITVPTSTSLNITNNITISAWIHRDGTDDVNVFVASKTPQREYELYHSSSTDQWRWYRNNHLEDATKSEIERKWFYFAMVDNATDCFYYLNETQFYTETQEATTPSTSTTDVNLFNRPGSNLAANMTMDEVRISNIDRNASWIKAEYHSVTTSDFLTWSSQLLVNVYDENTSAALSNWDIFITNQNGSTTYESTGNSNGLIINPSYVPTGENIAIKINKSYYDFRVYYIDIETSDSIELNTYLPPVNISELYLLSVVDEIDNPISDAKMHIKQYISESVGYEDVSILLTDANGQVDVYLIPGSWNSLYKIIINKTGYETEYADYIPSDEIFTHTFRMDFDDDEPTEPYVEGEEITFNGYTSGTTLYVNYTDALDETLNSSIYIYEVNYSTLTTTLYDSNTETTSNNYQITSTINISNSYVVYLHLNHTTFGYVFYSLFFEAINETTFTNQTFFDDLFDLNYGANPFGWSNIFMFLFLAGCFFSFGQRGSGISLMFTGGLILFINSVIGFNTTLAVAAGGGIPILFIIVGIMVLWRNAKREAWS